MVEKMQGVVGAQGRQAERQLLTAEQIKGAVEVKMVALWADAYNGSLPKRIPDVGESGLKVQAHLVEGEDKPVRVGLTEVNDFFSSCSSKSARATWLGLER